MGLVIDPESRQKELWSMESSSQQGCRGKYHRVKCRSVSVTKKLKIRDVLQILVSTPFYQVAIYFFFPENALFSKTCFCCIITYKIHSRNLMFYCSRGAANKIYNRSLCYRFCMRKHISVVDFVCTPCTALYCVDFVHTTIEMYFRYCIGSSYKM